MKIFVRQSPYRIIWLTLFVLVFIANTAYLQRVPGLMGDEASEGYNVYELLLKHGLKIQGERSYIGVFTDYVRIPFMGALGYTVAAIRAPMLLVTLILFWLSAAVFKRLFDEETALWIVAIVFFSPAYLLYQRLGWAITVLPFFAILLLFLLVRPHKAHTSLLVGVVAGLGVSTHILFLPTLMAIAVCYALVHARRWRQAVLWWPAAVGFWAAFSLQFFILFTMGEDQGDPSAVFELFSERLRALAGLAPQLVSQYEYVASFVDAAWGSTTINVVSLSIAALVLVALFSRWRKIVALWLIGIALHLLVLLAVIDRLSPRYFIVAVLGILILAAVGLKVGSTWILNKWGRRAPWLPAVTAVLLLWVTVSSTLVPFLQQKNSNDIASEAVLARVDIEPLLQCLNGKGPVLAGDPHIFNRLLYISLERPGLILVNKATEAKWSVVYRRKENADKTAEACPELKHFRVVKRI